MRTFYVVVILNILIVAPLFAQNIYTPKGSLVPTSSYFKYNQTKAQMDAFDEAVEDGVYGPTAVIISNSSNNYNCHGYAWNMYPSNGREEGLQEPGSNGGAVTAYIDDQSFMETTNTTLPGVIVRYEYDHSAIVINMTNRFFSKWGGGPLVRHAPGDAPISYGNPSSYYQCNYPSRLTHAQINNGTTSYGNYPSFEASTGAHRVDVYGTPHTTYSFATQPSVPGISIYGQYANTVLFDKPAYNQQGRYIFVTMSNGCTVPSAQTSIYVYDPPGASMVIYPVPTNDEVTILFADMEEKLAMEDMTYDGDGPSLPAIIEIFNGHNIKVHDLSEEVIWRKSNKVSLAHLGKGIYYIKATFKDGFVETKRVVIN